MQKWVSRTLAASLLLFALACGKPPPPLAEPGPAEAETSTQPLANTGQVTVHVKGMTKALNLT